MSRDAAEVAVKVLTLSYKTYSVIFILIYFLVLVFTNKFVIFSFNTILVFVFINKNHTAEISYASEAEDCSVCLLCCMH